ncbi:MAG: serine hydrolase [Rhodocyclaceae bacterium]|nr:serine hydrolase [Rhodocyclaceae bacterium]
MSALLTDITASTNRFLAGTLPSRTWMRTLPIAANLDSVTDCDSAAEIAPESVGVSTARVDAIWRAARGLYCTGYYPAIMLCVRRRGEIILNRAIGHASGYLPDQSSTDLVKATVNTPACIYSASKAMTAIAIHRLADSGKINLLDPVCHYIPEFAANGKDRLTIYQVLTHRGGVPGIPMDEPPQTVSNHKRMLELICAATPQNIHGRNQAYHALTGGTILQEVLERATGVTLTNYWRQHFKKPMGFRFLDYGASKADFNLMARDYVSGVKVPEFITQYLKPYLGVDAEKDGHLLNAYDFYARPIAAGNMVATAEELCRFFQMLLDNGSYKGQQIISPLCVHRATMESSPHQMDGVLKIPLRFSAGMMMGGDGFGLYGKHTGRAFGHLGLVNIFGWADPERDLSVGLITTGKPLLAPNLGYVAALIHAISGGIPRDGDELRKAA